MRGKLLFIGGLAAGFVLGARAGREKYEELRVQARKVLDHPTVQEAAGVAQAQANRLYSEGKDKLAHSKLGERLATTNTTSTSTSTTPTSSITAADDTFAGSRSSNTSI
ncbi:hypothetical protein [Catenuloplanes atrovinosus]|uniref:YtxH domain-containing protein n=1 Tax=Catenuloplanes atrovinosus TaxID=137266 RepID=A0AAE4CEE2_9ACTN|nr:hypothetical protein [Catenuloplanes atrovinosus]MDR7278535.1 hypothetical protein [Catenuloplanes atrovinosus]